MSSVLRLILVGASAAAYALSFPPTGFGPLILVAMAVLMITLNDCQSSQAFMLGLGWGVLAFGIGLPWFWNIFNVFCLLLWLILALFPALFAAVFAWGRSRGLQGGRLAVFAALAWTSTEFVRCEVMPLKFPWMHVGLALEPWPLVSWIGVYGLGFVAVWLVAALMQRSWKLAGWIALAGFAASLFEPIFLKSPGIPVAAIQAETAPLRTYLDLSKKVPPETKLIVWPEYAVSKDVRQSPDDLAAIQRFAAESYSLLIFGTQTRFDGPKWQNTALTVDGSRVLGEHGKVHTVHLFNDGEHGPTSKAIEVKMPPIGKIGTPICFDCDFQDVVRRMTLDGAEFFAVPSMDAAHWGAKQHIQHAQLFRVRAAENQRAFVVAASSGISQIIGSNGRTTAKLDALTQGVLSGQLIASRSLTFFTRWGWLTPWLLMTTLLLWIVALARRKTNA